MNIFILRHGIAVDHGTPGYAKDSDRPLTPEGEKKLRAAAKAMEKLELTFDLILTSPYVRARQTAAVLADGLGLTKRIEVTDHLAHGGSLEKLVKVLEEQKAEDVLLVGHEPDLSMMISRWLSGTRDLEINLKKGGLCKLSADEISAGRCAVFEWLLTPKQLSLLA